jgi:hypothetical protein
MDVPYLYLLYYYKLKFHLINQAYIGKSLNGCTETYDVLIDLLWKLRKYTCHTPIKG